MTFSADGKWIKNYGKSRLVNPESIPIPTLIDGAYFGLDTKYDGISDSSLKIIRGMVKEDKLALCENYIKQLVILLK